MSARTITEEPIKVTNYRVLKDRLTQARKDYFEALETAVTAPHFPDKRVVIRVCGHNCGTCGRPKCPDRDAGGSSARIIGAHTRICGCLAWIRKGAKGMLP